MKLARVLALVVLILLLAVSLASAQGSFKIEPQQPGAALIGPTTAKPSPTPATPGAPPIPATAAPPPAVAPSPAVAPTAPAAPVAAKEGAKQEEEHWTLFNLIPMEWTLPIAQTVAGWFGVTADGSGWLLGAGPNPRMYTNHGLLHVMIMFFVFLLITIFSLTVGAKYRKMLADPAPQPGVSGSNLLEMVVQAVLGLMQEIIGHDSEKYLPLIGTLAFVILFNNLLGLIPGFYTATDNWNTTLAFALTVIVMYHYYGIKTQGALKYLDHFLGPLEGKIKWIMAPLMLPIELISHIARLFSLSLRLFGNMFGDHKVFAVFMGLTVLPLLYPLPFLALGLLVAIVQTLVFCLLTMVYIGLATAKEH